MGLFVDPSVDFDFVDPVQFPDLVFNLFGIHCYYQSYFPYRNHKPYIAGFRLSYTFLDGLRLFLHMSRSFCQELYPGGSQGNAFRNARTGPTYNGVRSPEQKDLQEVWSFK